MWQGKRSSYLLGSLIAIAIANGFFLGLTLYGFAAVVVKANGNAFPHFYAFLVGALFANYLLVVSWQRERTLREAEYDLWTPLPTSPQEHPLVARLRGLTRASTLSRPPALGCIDSEEQNAFTVGRSPGEASIVLTSGLIESLTRAELDAVMAQQLAHIESEDVRAVGWADAVADSIDDLSRLKGRFLWGPTAIFKDLRPLIAVTIGGSLVLAILPGAPAGNFLVALFLLGVLFWVLYAFWQALKMSWRGLGQLLLFTAFFGPMSVVEAVLGPPTAVAVSMLVSRARVHEADERAVRLTGDREALASALRHVAGVEHGGRSPWLGERRYSLFVAPIDESGWWPWLARQRATHPPVADRLERIRQLP